MTIHPTVPRRRELHTPHQICTFERVAHLNPICPNALRTCISPPKSKENVIFTIAQKENFRERVPEIGVQSAVPSVVQTNSSCHESSHVYNENGWKTRLEHALRHCITFAFTDDARRESALAQSREPLRKLPKVHSDAPRSETHAIGIQTTVEDGFSSIGSTVSIAKIDRGTETLDECTSLDSITRLTQYLSTSHYAECVALEEENNVKLRSVAAHYRREMESMQRSHEQEVTALRSELHRMTQQRELDLERLHDTIRATQKDMHVEWASVHREVRALSDLAQTADALNNTDHAMQDDNPTLNSQLFECHLSPNASMLWGAHSKMKDASTWTESTECCLHLEEIEALKTLMFERQQRWAEITQDMERERAHWKLVCRRHSSQTVDWPMLVESKGVNTPPFDDIGTASHIALVGDDHTDRDKSPLGSASPSMDTLMLRRCQRNETLLNSQIAELTATTKFLRQYIDHITSQHKEVFRTYEWTLGELMTCTGHLRALVRSREVRYEAVCEEVIRMRELLEGCSSDLTAVRTERSRMSPRRTCETEQAIHPEHLSAGDV